MIVTFDFETTGANPSKDLPVQIAVVETDESWASQTIVSTLCNPGMPISKEAAQVTGIGEAEVRLAPPLWWAAEGMHHALALVKDRSPIVAGHNIIRFDLPMAWHTRPELKDVLGPQGRIDTLILARRYWPTAPHKLGELHEHLGLGKLEGAHGAAEDCYGVVRIIKELCELFGKTPTDLAKECERGKPYVIWPYGKHKGKNAAEVPEGYIRWCRDNFGDDIDMDQRASFEARLGR